ncbi:hypothetical protein F5Y14DRAFT_448018 [Nemania sp. NC0429]|nr:hypothetical protein F5Y14DRAFT_448018 [Nemania sp. NC0429]
MADVETTALRWLDVHKPGDPNAYRDEGENYVIEWDPEGSEGTFELQMLSFSNTPMVYPPTTPWGLPTQDFQWLTTVLDPADYCNCPLAAMKYSDKHYTWQVEPLNSRSGFNFTYRASGRDVNDEWLGDARPFNLFRTHSC